MAGSPDHLAPGLPRRPIVVALGLAVVATLLVVAIVALTRPQTGSANIEKGRPAPEIAGTTLEGEPFNLADLRGRPVVVNFWGPTCVPCRTEFPLLKQKLEEHAADDLVVVGILMADPPELARQFIADEGATWATVDDPSGAIKDAYRVVARPQSYFIDRDGILRSIQIGEVRDADFERQFDLIKGTS
ncbi:MAG TPA: TlpA disulfide reductase family protein [Candidatus Limnocylindrales bacterium]|nr:TlpA disulfide reductase family protein [Candidatus Limnocylindrales bacterium]